VNRHAQTVRLTQSRFATRATSFAGDSRARAAFLLEACAGLALIGVTFFVVAHLVIDYQRAHEAFTARWAAQLACEAQMEAYRAGEPIVDGVVDHDRLPARTTLTITSGQGRGDWAGLVRVTVRGTVTLKHGRSVTHSLTGYVARLDEVGTVWHDEGGSVARSFAGRGDS
jgi:hypothetical protein